MRLSTPSRTILIGGLGLVAVLWTLLGTLLTVTDAFFVRIGGTPQPDEVERVYGIYEMAVTLLVAIIGVGAGRHLRNTAPTINTRDLSRQRSVGRWFQILCAAGGLVTITLVAFRTLPMLDATRGRP